MKHFISSISSNQFVLISKTEFNSLLSATSDGGILNLNNKMVVCDKSYTTINKNVTIKNGGFKRANTVTATLTQEVNIGDTVFFVDDASPFSVNDHIGIVFDQGMDQHAGLQGLHYISAINGNEITVPGSHFAARYAPVGSTMIWSYSLLNLPSGNTVVFDNITIDGNKVNNDYTYDWKLNSIATIFDGMVFQNGHIKNTSGESFFMQEGSSLLNNTALNLNGSFAHFSNASATPTETITVKGNTGDGVCQQPLTLNGHNEGCMTFSARSQNLLIEDNDFKNGGEACYGSQGLDDFNINVQNNTWDNFKEKVKSITGGHSDPIDTSLDTFINTPNGI